VARTGRVSLTLRLFQSRRQLTADPAREKSQAAWRDTRPVPTEARPSPQGRQPPRIARAFGGPEPPAPKGHMHRVVPFSRHVSERNHAMGRGGAPSGSWFLFRGIRPKGTARWGALEGWGGESWRAPASGTRWERRPRAGDFSIGVEAPVGGSGVPPPCTPGPDPELGRPRAYSHSIVAGGLEEMSRATRLTSRISLMIRFETRSSRSYGSRAQSAVIASSEVTARITIG